MLIIGFRNLTILEIETSNKQKSAMNIRSSIFPSENALFYTKVGKTVIYCHFGRYFLLFYTKVDKTVILLPFWGYYLLCNTKKLINCYFKVEKHSFASKHQFPRFDCHCYQIVMVMSFS